MSRSLLRRLDDAFCAFRTGHSRRDLDRTNWRRLQLLCERAIASDQTQIDTDETALVGSLSAQILDAFRNDLQRFLQSRDRSIHCVLAKRLYLRRYSLHCRRLDEFARRKAGGNIVDAALYYAEALSVPPAKTYGKLYKGLLKERPFDHLFRKQFFRGLDGHRVLRSLKRCWLFCVRANTPASDVRSGPVEYQPASSRIANDLWPDQEERGHG